MSPSNDGLGFDVGTIIGFQNPAAWRAPWPRVYVEGLEFAQMAEELGLDEVWLTEHHFVEDGYCPSLLPVAAAIAARTSTIRIGTKAMLLPFHDPIRLAEDAAVVDVVSGGRLDLGLAAGYRPGEFEGFGLDPRERGARMSEGLEIVARALAGEELEFRGRFHSYGRARLVPPPVQRPLPLWMGGRSTGAMRRAATFGCHLMLADFILENARSDYEAYVEALVEAGRDPAQFRVVAVAVVFVDEDEERAWQRIEPHLLYQQNQYRRWFGESGDRATDRFDTALDRSQLEEGSYFIGNPDTVATGIRRFREEVPFTDFSSWTMLPGLSFEDAARSLGLFVNEVLPRI
jgi:alkanesulfonate monooxygenase SsuD/methylene tetrahydromethanopterin reductase-like flavin-dependent oxidoreductase (luciferase family)